MESLPNIGNASMLHDKGLKAGLGSLAKRPCTVLLEENIEDNFQPTEEELLEYALWLGMNIPRDMDLIWIARDGLTQPLPAEWKPCQTEDDEIYYFNFETGESVWDHPCDGLYRKLYQEECKKLGKRPSQILENSSCSSNFQQQTLIDWGEGSTQSSHHLNYDDMLNEKENLSPRNSPVLQDDIGLERLPSNKEIQMNIVEKEIDSLKGIRDQLLHQMNALWQGEQFSPLANQLVVESVGDYNQLEQNNLPLLERSKGKNPSLELDHDVELKNQSHRKNWSNVQLEEEHPRKTQARTEMLRKQLEMARMIPGQLTNRAGVENINDQGQMFEDDERYKDRNSTGPPMLYASKVSQEANGKHSSVSDEREILHRAKEELKKEELVLLNEMKERILGQIRKSMEVFEKNSIEEEYDLTLKRKKKSNELLRNKLRKDMEFQLLLEEESILKRKRDEILAMLQKQMGRDKLVEEDGSEMTRSTKVLSTSIEKRNDFKPNDEQLSETKIERSIDFLRSNCETLATTLPVAQEYDLSSKTREIQSKGKEALCQRSDSYEEALSEDEKNATLDIHGVSPPLHSAPVVPRQDLGIGEDLKELFLQCRSELRDGLVSLKSKMNKILVSHSKADQMNLETSSSRTVPIEDNGKASYGAMLIDASSTEFLCTLQKSIGELDANLKRLLEKREVGLHSKNNANAKDHQSKLSSQNHKQLNGHGPGCLFTNILSILKKFLLTLDEVLEKNSHHHEEEMIKNDKLEYFLSQKGDEALDMKNDSLSIEASLLLKRLIKKVEKQVEGQILQQGGKSRDKTPCLRTDEVEIPEPTYGRQSQSISLSEELSKRIFDVHGIVTQLKALFTDMICNLKGFIGQLGYEIKERIQQGERELKYEMDGSRPHNESTRCGHTILQNQKTLQSDDDIIKRLEVTRGEAISFEKLSIDALGMLERFTGTLHRELEDHISRQGNKACKDIDKAYQIDSKCIVEQDTDFLLHETSLQAVKQISSGDICGSSSTIPDISYSAVSPDTKSNLLGITDGLDRGIMSSMQHKIKTGKDQISTFPIRSATEDNLMLHEINPKNQSVPPRLKSEEMPHDHKLELVPHTKLEIEQMPDDHILELDKLSTKSLYTLEKFRNELGKELHDQVLLGARGLEVSATSFKPETLGNISASFLEGSNLETSNKSISHGKVKKTIDAHSISHDIMLFGLKRFIAEVDKELKAIIQNCKRKYKHENGRMRPEMNEIEHHEFYSQTEESELKSQPVIPILKAWSTEIEKSTEHLLQHFKRELLEEMHMMPKKEANEASTLRSINCDELRPQNPQHLTQVQTLVAEEKRIWYDILNDATKQWLQKEWVERLEHQSDLTTTGDPSISPPNSETLIQVQKVLGEEKKIMYDILNHSTQKWLVHQRNPLGSLRNSEVKETAVETLESQKGVLRDEHTLCVARKEKCCTPNDTRAGKHVERNQSKARSHNGVIVHSEEDGQSKFFTNDLEVMGRCPGNFNFCMIQSSCLAKENGSICAHEVDQKAKLLQNISMRKNSLSTVNRWISKSEPFGAFNHTNKVDLLQDGGLCEECQEQIIGIHGVRREVEGSRGKMPEPRGISQLKLLSKRKWQTMQLKLKAAQATRWAHIIASWAFGQISCGLLLKDTSYPTFAIQKSIKAIIGKITCGKVYDSTNLEGFQNEMGSDNHEESNIDDPRCNIIQRYCCYPFMNPHVTRSTKHKNENRNDNLAPVDWEGFVEQNSAVAHGEVKCNSPRWIKFDASPNMDERDTPSKDDEDFHRSIANSSVKYKIDDDLALSIVEKTQCDGRTPTTSNINLREVDMHQLEEAINNLRNTRELEAKGKALWVNHSHPNANHFEDQTKDYVKPEYQSELDYMDPLDLANGDQDVHRRSSNSIKRIETEDESFIGQVPKFITFEILQQGEIALPKSVSLTD